MNAAAAQSETKPIGDGAAEDERGEAVEPATERSRASDSVEFASHQGEAKRPPPRPGMSRRVKAAEALAGALDAAGGASRERSDRLLAAQGTKCGRFAVPMRPRSESAPVLGRPSVTDVAVRAAEKPRRPSPRAISLVQHLKRTPLGFLLSLFESEQGAEKGPALDGPGTKQIQRETVQPLVPHGKEQGDGRSAALSAEQDEELQHLS